MNDRGKLKWAPYKSLEKQADFLARLEYERNKIPCPQISSDKAEEINEILTNHYDEMLIVKYWQNGYIYTIHGRISSISTLERYIAIENVEIPFRYLTSVTLESEFSNYL